jgi:hypothetical protein
MQPANRPGQHGALRPMEPYRVGEVGRAAAPPPGSFESVSIGTYHSCGLLTNGQVVCWGDSFQGQLDAPEGMFRSVSSGFDHSCAIRPEGDVECWGRNEEGQALPPPGPFRRIAAGGRVTCGIRPDSTLECWGEGTLGTSVPPSGQFWKLSNSSTHFCGVRTDRTLVCENAEHACRERALNRHSRSRSCPRPRRSSIFSSRCRRAASTSGSTSSTS